jgi:hypothetical protein
VRKELRPWFARPAILMAAVAVMLVVVAGLVL